MLPPVTQVLHPAPPGVDYTINGTPFGQILRGTLPARVWRETYELLSFQDRTPRAPLHALVIPKRYVMDVTQLTTTNDNDTELLLSMRALAASIVREQFPEAARSKDYILCFHIPPFNSVNHLHLHVLAPASEMHWWLRDGKYRLETPWCTSIDTVLQRLDEGQSPTPPRWWWGAFRNSSDE